MVDRARQHMLLRDLASARDVLLDRLAEQFAADDRVLAAWLAGSLGRNVADDWSDLDLHVVVRDADLPAMLGERASLYARVGEPVLVQPEIPANAGPGGIFQLVFFAGGVELDLTMYPASRAACPAATRLLFDKVGVPPLTAVALPVDTWRERTGDRLAFFWAMAPIAVKYAGRGATARLVGMIDLLHSAYLDLWNLLHGDPMSLLPVNVTNAPLDPALAARMPVLDTVITPGSGLDVVMRMIQDVASWHPDCAARGVLVPDAMPETVGALAAIARSTMPLE